MNPGPAEGVGGSFSRLDPFGHLQEVEGGYVRQISTEAAGWLKPLYENGTLDHWMQEAHLVPCEAVDNGDQHGAWLVRHPAIRPLTVPAEWCASMLKDAALATLDLLLAVDREGLTLQDAHPHNVVFEGARPVFVDLTSVVPQPPQRMWDAYNQFLVSFRNSLLLHSDGKGRWARAALLGSADDSTPSAVYPLLSVRRRLARPGLALAAWIERRMQSSAALREFLRKAASRTGKPIDPAIRTRLFQRLRRSIESIDPVPERRDTWAAYYDGEVSDAQVQRKMEAVARVLQSAAPRSVVDMGCNTGQFSKIAATAGAKVLAIDASEACCEALYREARQQSLPITPIVANIVAPTPAHGFLARQYGSLPERARSDAVLCLGLTHHLMVTGCQTEQRVAELVADLTWGTLAIVELIEPDDANVSRLNSARPAVYRSEALTDALGRRFASIEIVASDRPSRRLAICRQ